MTFFTWAGGMKTYLSILLELKKNGAILYIKDDLNRQFKKGRGIMNCVLKNG